MENQKTHWKKNIDSRYISGEDLKASLRGLKPEMVVVVADMKDSPTFDQQSQKEIIKTSLWLKDLSSGQMIYKPVILNTTNAKFFTNEFKSEFIEDWYNKPVVLFAQPDKRFGHVARFKHYYPPAQITDKEAIAFLKKSANKKELQDNWTNLSAAEKNLPTVIALKDQLKTTLP